MPPVKVTKEEADRIMKIGGNVSGAIFKGYYQYLLDKKKEGALGRIEKRLKELGYSLKLKEFSSFKWYPEAQACLICLVILEVFGWEESKAFDIGYDAPLYSIVTKLLMKYVSVEKILKDGPKYWRKHFDFGDMKCIDYDAERSYATMRLSGFKKYHQIVYTYIRGYLVKLIEMATKSKNVEVKQTKSLYNNDPYDEFKIDWKQ
jgi:hypothetical protein